jgi:acetyl-CoA carboxylase biotin carboxyl carrier protein
MQKSDLTELEIELQEPNIKLRLARPGTALVGGVSPTQAPQQQITSQVQSVAPSAPAKTDDGLHSFDSPMVGTFYRKPSPDDAAFVEVGDVVKKGDVLCIVEAMKVMNEIQSDVAGEIIEILVEDSTSIEYGQALFKIRKS